VSADVPSSLDNVIIRALLQRPTRQGPPIQSPAEFADALASVAPPAPLPEPAPPAPAGYPGQGYGGYGPDPNNPDTWGVPGPSGTAPYQAQQPTGQFAPAGYGGMQYTGAQQYSPGHRGGKRGTNRGMMAAVVVLVLIVIAVLVWAVGFRKSGSSPPAGGSTPSSSASAAAGGTALKPASDSTFNIYGSPAGNTENQSTAPAAIDGNPATAWSTSYYFNHPNFGGLKPGTGLLIDMGKQVRLSQVDVLFAASGSTTASIYLGNNPAMANTALGNFTLVSPSVSASGDHKFPVSSQATGRYVLIWLTSLPKLSETPQGAPAGNTYYEGQIYNVVVRGSAASGNS
jgi:hypothetical protein